MRKKNVLVTGGSGFIGSRLADVLRRRGHRVFGVDRRQPPNAGKSFNRFLRGPICAERLHKTGFAPDWIFHCAGGGSVGFAETHPMRDFQMNVVSTLELLQYARSTGCRTKVVLLSSAAIYGNAGKKKLGEKQPPQPVSNYGFHKHMAELLFRFYAGKWSVPCVVVRIFSVYGEGLRKQVFWDAANKFKKGEVMFSGTGRETRDFIHVEDLCRLLIELAPAASPEVPIYNCGLGEPIRLETALGHLATFLQSPAPRFNKKVRSGDPRHLVADPGKVFRIGWRPKIRIEKGVRRYAAWFKRNT